MYKINLLDTNESSLFDENSAFWQHYEVLDENRKVIMDGFRLFDVSKDDISSEEIILEIKIHIQTIGGVEKFPKLNQLSKPLKELVLECHQSDNEMWFVDEGDEWLEDVDIDKLHREVENLHWTHTVIEIDDDNSCGDGIITVYGGISELVNFVD